VLEKFGGDSVAELERHWASYRSYLEGCRPTTARPWR
jgi:hypothetical protein